MNLSTKKLDLIERVMQIREESILKNYEDLLTQAELQSRTDESLKAIQVGEVISIDEFNNSNKQWLKKNSTK
jgi:hypothetical protein